MHRADGAHSNHHQFCKIGTPHFILHEILLHLQRIKHLVRVFDSHLSPKSAPRCTAVQSGRQKGFSSTETRIDVVLSFYCVIFSRTNNSNGWALEISRRYEHSLFQHGLSPDDPIRVRYAATQKLVHQCFWRRLCFNRSNWWKLFSIGQSVSRSVYDSEVIL